MKAIIRNSFFQLLAVYTILVFLLSINKISRYFIPLELFALILAVFGLFLAGKEEKINLPKWLIFLALSLILLFRIIPYIGNSVPLGYDAGIYKAGFEIYRDNLPLDAWLEQQPPLLYWLGKIFYFLGFSTSQILIHFFILFNLLLGFAVYLAAKKFFNEQTGLIAILLYSVSIVQFKVFEMMYYKNIIALSLLLFSFYFLASKKYIPLVIAASLMGGLHRPTYLIFALSFITYTLKEGISLDKKSRCWLKINAESLKKNILAGISIILLTSLFYLGNFKSMIIDTAAETIASPSAGTFINFLTYQFLSLAYLPFALMGLLFLIKRKQFNVLFFWFLINGAIVYFKLFFFNRYIIMLDLIMIILAASAIFTIIQNKKGLGTAIAVILILSAGILTFNEARNAKPLVSQDELNLIMSLNETGKDALVMSTYSYYSPWVYGYSGRRTIAPGLFDYDKWNYSDWALFWASQNETEAREMLGVYEKPLYIFIGKNQPDYIRKFNSTCFARYSEGGGALIYRYGC